MEEVRQDASGYAGVLVELGWVVEWRGYGNGGSYGGSAGGFAELLVELGGVKGGWLYCACGNDGRFGGGDIGVDAVELKG